MDIKYPDESDLNQFKFQLNFKSRGCESENLFIYTALIVISCDTQLYSNVTSVHICSHRLLLVEESGPRLLVCPGPL